MLKIQSSIQPDPQTRPTFNEWAKEFNVSADYVEPQNDTFKLTKPLKPKELTFWEWLKEKII